MRNHYLNLLFIVTSLAVIHSATCTKRFTVVSYSRSVIQLYSRIKTTSSESPRSGSLDGPTKERICRDITGSHYFGRRGLYSIDDKRLWSCFSSCVPVSIEEIEVVHPLIGNTRENVFVCVAGNALSSRNYYVSDEYNLEPKSDDDDDIDDERPRVTGRFVFRAEEDAFKLYALAEESSKVVFSLDYGVEQLYARRKEVYNVADRMRRDPLCRLEDAEKARICLAVFSASYFHRKFRFSSSSSTEIVRASCEWTTMSTVSFQTEDGKAKAVEKESNEWMMTCKEPSAKGRSFDYLLSQAYEPNQVFVYLRDNSTGDIFLETLGTNIRLNVFYPFRIKK